MLVLRIIATVLLVLSFLTIVDWKVKNLTDMIAVLIISGTWRAFVIVLLWLL